MFRAHFSTLFISRVHWSVSNLASVGEVIYLALLVMYAIWYSLLRCILTLSSAMILQKFSVAYVYAFPTVFPPTSQEYFV